MRPAARVRIRAGRRYPIAFEKLFCLWFRTIIPLRVVRLTNPSGLLVSFVWVAGHAESVFGVLHQGWGNDGDDVVRLDG